MERLYTVTLKFSYAIPHPVFETNFEGYITSLGLFAPEETALRGTAGTLLHTRHKDGNILDFDWYSVHIRSVGYVEELEALRSAITIAKQLESAAAPLDPKLAFNPNLVFLSVGTDSEGNKISYEDFMPNAVKLQEILYGGGNIGYYAASGDLTTFLGLTEMFRRLSSPKRIIRVGERARRAASLDDLLSRLEQNQSPQ